MNNLLYFFEKIIFTAIVQAPINFYAIFFSQQKKKMPTVNRFKHANTLLCVSEITYK